MHNSKKCTTFAAGLKNMYHLIGTGIEADREKRVVRKDGREIRLTGLEFGLLDYLSSHANHICTRDKLLERVWGERFRYDTGTIDVHLNALRRKLGFSKSAPIETIRGVGFIYHTEERKNRYTIDLQAFLTAWLQRHEVEIRAAGMVAQLQLTPFVNEMTIAPEALQQMLDSILAALLPGAQPGKMKVSTKLTMTYFTLSIDVNGTISELRIPISGDF